MDQLLIEVAFSLRFSSVNYKKLMYLFESLSVYLSSRRQADTQKKTLKRPLFGPPQFAANKRNGRKIPNSRMSDML
jgi:hypothetical protein